MNDLPTCLFPKIPIFGHLIDLLKYFNPFSENFKSHPSLMFFMELKLRLIS